MGITAAPHPAKAEVCRWRPIHHHHRYHT